MAIICTRDGAATIWFLFAMFKIFFIVVVGWLRELLYVFEGMYVFNLASTCLAKGTHEEYNRKYGSLPHDVIQHRKPTAVSAVSLVIG
jgi:hypothetical protein